MNSNNTTESENSVTEEAKNLLEIFLRKQSCGNDPFDKFKKEILSSHIEVVEEIRHAQQTGSLTAPVGAGTRSHDCVDFVEVSAHIEQHLPTDAGIATSSETLHQQLSHAPSSQDTSASGSAGTPMTLAASSHGNTAASEAFIAGMEIHHHSDNRRYSNSSGGCITEIDLVVRDPGLSPDYEAVIHTEVQHPDSTNFAGDSTLDFGLSSLEVVGAHGMPLEGRLVGQSNITVRPLTDSQSSDSASERQRVTVCDPGYETDMDIRGVYADRTKLQLDFQPLGSGPNSIVSDGIGFSRPTADQQGSKQSWSDMAANLSEERKAQLVAELLDRIANDIMGKGSFVDEEDLEARIRTMLEEGETGSTAPPTGKDFQLSKAFKARVKRFKHGKIQVSSSTIDELSRAQSYSDFSEVLDSVLGATPGWKQISMLYYLTRQAVRRLASSPSDQGAREDLKQHSMRYFDKKYAAWVQHQGGWQAVVEETEDSELD